MGKLGDEGLETNDSLRRAEASGFTPIWLVLARFMVSQCRRCKGKGWIWRELVEHVRCPDCAELRALVGKEKGEGE